MYICDKCNQSFRKKHYFDQHYKQHTQMPEKISKTTFTFVYNTCNILDKTSFQGRIFYYNDSHYTKINYIKRQHSHISFINLYDKHTYEIRTDDILFLMVNKEYGKKIETIQRWLSKFSQGHRFMYINKNPYHANLNTVYNQLESHIDCVYSQFMNSKSVWIPGHHRLWHIYDNHIFKSFMLTQKTQPSKTICVGPSSTSRGQIIKKSILQYFIHAFPEMDVYEQNSCYKQFEKSIPLKKNRKNTDIQTLCRDKTDIFKEYKYVVIIENDLHYGCMTEKLIDALGCLSLPIYFGSYRASTFAPELFDDGVIDGFSYTLPALIELLKTMSDEEYRERVAKIQHVREYYYRKHSFHEIGNFMIKDIIWSVKNAT